MSNDQVNEAIILMSKLTMDEIQSVVQAIQQASNHVDIAAMLSEPNPPFGAEDVKGIYNDWQPEQRMHLAQLGLRYSLGRTGNRELDKALLFRDSPEAYEWHATYLDGTKAWRGVSRTDRLLQRVSDSVEKQSMERSTKYQEAVLKASQKIGIPKTTADVKVDTLMRTALMRNAANAAGVNMAMTALFDMKTLLDGDFQNYFVKLGISGIYGGTVSGCSTWIKHPIFGHSAVVGIIVGSAFNMASVASTGDWARFGKETGLGIIGSTGAWGGAQVGAYAGAAAGPIGIFLGGVVGGFAGGFAGRFAAGKTTNLAELTDAEVDNVYNKFMEVYAKMGISPDPSLSRRETVTRLQVMDTSTPVLVRMTEAMAADCTSLRNSLADWQQGNQEDFELFLQGLRDAAARQ